MDVEFQGFRSILIGQKMVENAKIEKFECDILSDFQTMCILQDYLYDHLGSGFEDVSHDPNRKSQAWRHFFYNKLLDKSKCKHCKYVVKNHQGSTKSLLGHLRNKHQIFVENTK